MIEVYRDRLKLDVMVVNAYNQILTIQPDNFEAADALAAQYETMKRWPDLIALLRKKAAVVESAEDKIALHAKVANLFLEKFSNQAEAIKAYEAILELDPDNSEALGFVKQMYEKRRDWEKLIAVNQREIDKLKDADERKARRIEVAKLASEKMKKASVSIELWQKVLADDDVNVEALGELEKLYEREKAWAELGAVLERQVAASDDATRKSAIYVKLGILFTEKVHNAAQATSAWQALLAMEPENRRAQDALKKLYLQSKDWNALEAFYASQNKWDELVRVLERQAESEDEAGRVSLWNKIGELYRDRLNKGDRAQKAYEKALSFDAQNLPAALALIPLYEKAKEIKRLGEVLLIELGHVREPAERHPRMQRLADLLDLGGGDKRGALRIALQALAEVPSDQWAITTSRRLAAESGGWPELVEAYEAAVPRANVTGPGGRAGAAGDAGGRLRGRAGQSRAGDRAQPEDPLDLRQGTRRGGGARTPLHRDRPLRRPARHLRQEARDGEEQGGGAGDPLQARDPVRRRDQAAGQGDRALSRDHRPGSRTACRRWRRWTACISSSVAGRICRRRSPRRSISRPTSPRSPS